MTPDRLDDLLERTLAAGEIPTDATAEERAQLQPLLGRARELRLNASTVRAEADATLPTARARFQRHLESQRPAAVAPLPAAKARSSWFGARFGARTMTFASSAAVIAVIAVLALVVLQPFSSPETASALTVDDYVQVQGVVSESGTGMVTVQAPDLGNLEVLLSDLTAVTDANGTREPASLKPGDPVLVSGIVTARRKITASNVAVAANQGMPTPVSRKDIPLLDAFREGIQGRLNVISLAPNGSRARVLLALQNGPLLVDIDGPVMDRFLAANPDAVGSIVRVVRSGTGKGLALELVEPGTAPPAGTAGQAQFETVRGVVIGRTLNILQVRTDRGIVPVALRPSTSIRFGDSGLTPDDIRSGETVIGWEVSVSGNVEDPAGRRIIATIVVVVGKAPQRPAAQ